MTSWSRFAGAILLVLAPAILAGEATAPDAKPDADAAASRECNLQQYQIHLSQLQALVDRCAHAPSTASCDARAVGPDDSVAISSGRRQVSYAWLRTLLADAPSVKGAEAKAASDRDLTAAASRLEEDQEISRASISAGSSAGDSANPAATNAATAKESESEFQERKTLAAILAGDGFHHDSPPGPVRKWLGRLRNWIIERLIGVAAFSREARWITRAMIAGVLLAACAGVALWVRRRSRQQRLGLLSFSDGLLPETAGEERAWERWSREGRQFAEEGRWREAIHSLYWAAIAALGTRGAWPEDRARTPREYLAVLRPGNTHRADLYAFTRSFEGIWYGHQPADKDAYEKALLWLERLAAR